MAARPTATKEPLRLDAAPVNAEMGEPVGDGGVTLQCLSADVSLRRRRLLG